MLHRSIAKKLIWLATLALFFSLSAEAGAQSRSWGYITDASKRFYVLPDFYDLAVLDRVTGLIWIRTPSTGATTIWPNAESSCNQLDIGAEVDGRPGITGWRLPAAHEIMTLVAKYKTSCPPSTACGDTVYKLPEGHPFTVPDISFWTSTAYLSGANPVALAFSLGGGGGVGFMSTDSGLPVWCVRGPN